jgi:cytochrome oxidase Cu insertion factor (SCO1/SenC/PrrC family)
MMNEACAPAKRPKTQVWVLVGIFFFPLLSAFVLYYGHGWRPSGSTSHGDLITPPRTLPDVALTTPAGPRDSVALFHGKWTLVFIGSGECETQCRQSLAQSRQVRLALGDDSDRVQRVFLNRAPCCAGDYLEREHPGLVLALLPDSATGLIGAFPAYNGVSPESASRTYVVDPLGNLMMSYAPGSASKGMLEDLKKLLKLSHIG